MSIRISFLYSTVFACLLVLPAVATAQDLTADELLRKSIEARGGQERWDAVSSMEWSGNFSTFSVKAPFVVRFKRPDLYRFDFKYAGQDITLGHGPEVAWWINQTFFTFEQWAVEVPVTRGRAIEGEAEFGGPLFDSEKKGHRVTLHGRIDLDGEDVYRLQVDLSNGSAETWYLDAKTYLPVARDSKGADLQEEIQQRHWFSDYREVDGLRFPHFIEIDLSGRYQTMEIEEIKINPELPDALFALAIPEGMERLAAMEGDWQVTYTGQRPLPAAPVMQGEMQSAIRASFRGALLEEEASFLEFGTPRQVRRTWTYDRFREVFRVARFDNMTFHLNVLEGRFDDQGRLVVSNLETGTSWVSKGRTAQERETISELGSDGFSLTREMTFDGGQTWIPIGRFVYTRRAP